MANRRALFDNEVENVIGGAFVFNRKSETLTYYHDDGAVTTYHILDYDNAWNSSNRGHASNQSEDDILQTLISRGYVE